MRKKTVTTTTVLEPVKLKSKVMKKRKLDVEARAPIEATASRATLSKAKDMADLTKQVSWAKVLLNARKTSGNFVKLHLVNVLVFSAEDNTILLTGTSGAFAEASVWYKALKAGDNFLIRFFIDVISNGSQFQVATFGGTAPVTMTLNAGPHEIPVVATAQAAGDHSVQMLLTTPNRSFYLQGLEIQPLAE
jgi:hypothetical protein